MSKKKVCLIVSSVVTGIFIGGMFFVLKKNKKHYGKCDYYAENACCGER